MPPRLRGPVFTRPYWRGGTPVKYVNNAHCTHRTLSRIRSLLRLKSRQCIVIERNVIIHHFVARV